MANLSYAELKRVWLDASVGTKYHNNVWASLMAAIALAESSGDPNATNPTDNGGTQTSWGLWQLSDGTHGQVSPDWANPVVNGRLAVDKLNSQGLSAWGTYNSGAYKGYLNDSTTPSATIPATGGRAGQAVATLTAAEAASAQAAGGNCALGYDQHVGILFGHGPTIQFCVISKTQVRAFAGAMYIVAGGLTALVGVAILAIATVPGFTAGRLVRAIEKAPGAAGRAAPRVQQKAESYQGRHRAESPRPAPEPPADRSRYDYRRPENRRRLGPDA